MLCVPEVSDSLLTHTFRTTMHSNCVCHLSPLNFSLVWTTQTASLFTVVLSACPSRISRSHNPLFIPTEARQVCKWTWAMADKERPTSPLCCLRHTQREATQPQTHTLANNSAEKEQMREVFLFFSPGYCLPYSLFPLRFYVMSPCKKKPLWLFQTSWLWVRWGGLWEL